MKNAIHHVFISCEKKIKSTLFPQSFDYENGLSKKVLVANFELNSLKL